ncbi:MAG: adenosylcobinamide-GDP ribazoletransferase [Alphaproteobacteria bacterium]
MPPIGAGAAARTAADLAAAMRFLTRVPIPVAIGPLTVGPGDPARALGLFPLVGAAIGAAAGAVLAVGAALGLPPAAAVLVALAAGMLLTGALHEDGLADTADGLGGGRDRERRLAIMRDSRIGTYGALALGMVVAIKAAALAALDPWPAAAAMIAAAAASRAALAPVAFALPPARADGLGAALGRPSGATVALAVATGIAIAAAALGAPAAAVALAAAALAAAALARLARRLVGGYTGDVLGAIQQVTETAMLLAATAMR